MPGLCVVDHPAGIRAQGYGPSERQAQSPWIGHVLYDVLSPTLKDLTATFNAHKARS